MIPGQYGRMGWDLCESATVLFDRWRAGRLGGERGWDRQLCCVGGGWRSVRSLVGEGRCMIVKSLVCERIPMRGWHRVGERRRTSGYELVRGVDRYEGMRMKGWSDHRPAYDDGGGEVRGSQRARVVGRHTVGARRPRQHMLR